MSKKVLWIALTAFLVGCVANDLADNLDGGFVSEANAGIAEIWLEQARERERKKKFKNAVIEVIKESCSIRIVDGYVDSGYIYNTRSHLNCY